MFNSAFLLTYQPLHLASNSFLLHAFLLLVPSNITHYHFFVSLLHCFFASRIQPEFQMGVVGSSLIFHASRLLIIILGSLPLLSSFFFNSHVCLTCRSECGNMRPVCTRYRLTMDIKPGDYSFSLSHSFFRVMDFVVVNVYLALK